MGVMNWRRRIMTVDGLFFFSVLFLFEVDDGVGVSAWGQLVLDPPIESLLHTPASTHACITTAGN
jgi:hypothetical protein